MTEGSIEAIYIASGAGGPMLPLQEVLAVEGEGLAGDRYGLGTGYWSAVDGCQATFIEIEELEWLEKESSISLMKGEHRRNIVTRGLFLFELRDTRFTAGEAEFEYERPRPSCEYIETITAKGMEKALEGERGGICARVIKSGIIRVGDAIAPRNG